MVECTICLEACIKKSSPKCSQCQKQVCVRCMSTLVKVCSSGCACYSWGRIPAIDWKFIYCS